MFELTPTADGGWTEKVLHAFGLNSNEDGASPYGEVIFDAAGNLYGTTYFGGAYGGGTVFELTPTADGGWRETVLHYFDPNDKDGFNPGASLIFDAAGNLYGAARDGGDYGGLYDGGTVFELLPQAGGGWKEKILHPFNPNCKDGARPSSNLIFDAAGNLYGTTWQGGAYGGGTVFKITP